MSLTGMSQESVIQTQGSSREIDLSALPIESVVLEGQRYRPLYFLGKRVVDIVLSATLLVLLSPLFLFIAILIRLDSPGPVIFRQTRVGVKPYIRRRKIHWKLRSFSFLKFRSMVKNADPAWHQASVRDFCSGSNGGATHSKATDKRVTRLGRLLRKTSLDELPQLFNVLKGDMSLVGPRPVPLYEVALYKEPQFRRLAALPGITGIWQVKGRTRIPFPEMVRMDIHYAEHTSFWLDLKILCMTVPAVLFAKGAE